MGERAPVKILLDDVGEAMSRSPDDPTDPLLDRETGEIVFHMADLDGEASELDVLLEENPERFLSIPRIESREEYRWMERFADDVDADHDAKRRLQDALSGRGAFGRFKNVLRDDPALCDKWFAARAEHLATEATHWLEAERVVFEPVRRRPPPVAPEAPRGRPCPSASRT